MVKRDLSESIACSKYVLPFLFLSVEKSTGQGESGFGIKGVTTGEVF